MSQIVACIDGSRATPAVCDYAGWASQRLDAPVMLMHVLDEQRYPVEPNLVGNIGLGSREALLEELADLDHRRNKLALEHGHHILDDAERRLKQQGITDPIKRQRHGDLVESLVEMEQETRLLVAGLHGEGSDEQQVHIGSQLETMLRRLHRPILLVPDAFQAPRNALIAFDGSPTTIKGLELLAGSPLLRGMPLHIVMVGADTGDRREALKQAERTLSPLAADIHLTIRAGDVEKTIHAYQEENDLDLLIMGAYGHSRIRQFLLGSTTTEMLKTAIKPLIILR